MKFAAATNKRRTSAFTLVEVLAALLFMAIVIPVAVDALHVASLAGEVAARKAVATRIADRVLNENATSAEPYISWVKEGRKYDLGAVLVTQQPGSIPMEILSQGDNWFIFHLLSAGDLGNVKRANAHFIPARILPIRRFAF